MTLLSWHSPLAKPHVFVSYAAERNALAERLALTLMTMGYAVFYDRHRIAAGESFTPLIFEALDRCDLLVFLVSPASVAKGHFALSELGVVRRRWLHPAGRVLAVMVDETPMDALPAYLRVTSVLRPQGDVVADIVTEVNRMATGLEHQRGSSLFRRAVRCAGGVAGAAGLAALLQSAEIVCLSGLPGCYAAQALRVSAVVLAPAQAASIGIGVVARSHLLPAGPGEAMERDGPGGTGGVHPPEQGGSAGKGKAASPTSSLGRAADTIAFVVRWIRGRPACFGVKAGSGIDVGRRGPHR